MLQEAENFVSGKYRFEKMEPLPLHKVLTPHNLAVDPWRTSLYITPQRTQARGNVRRLMRDLPFLMLDLCWPVDGDKRPSFPDVGSCWPLDVGNKLCFCYSKWNPVIYVRKNGCGCDVHPSRECELKEGTVGKLAG